MQRCLLQPIISSLNYLLLLSVFGKVVEGMSIVRTVETAQKDSNDRPLEPITVKESGEVPM